MKVENVVKEQKGGFFGILGATLGASLLESKLSGKEITQAGKGVVEVADGAIRKKENFQYCLFL